MRIGNFSAFIPEGLEGGSGHVSLEHGQTYHIKMANHDHSRRTDAKVEVDGKVIGEFRLNVGATATLETPPDDAGKGKFTFYQSGSADATKVGEASIEWENRGLVRVTFRPERRSQEHLARACSMSSDAEEKTSGGILRTKGMGGMSFASQNAAAGVTGLSGHSDQTFYHVSPLDHDPAGEVVITLRLVCGQEEPRPLQSSPRANPVPAAVG